MVVKVFLVTVIVNETYSFYYCASLYIAGALASEG